MPEDPLPSPEPCPFCGSTDITVETKQMGTAVEESFFDFCRCELCKGAGPFVERARFEPKDADAINFWNDREGGGPTNDQLDT